MLLARSVMDEWIGEDGGVPHVKTLTAYFFALYFIMATQVCAEWSRFIVGCPILC